MKMCCTFYLLLLDMPSSQYYGLTQPIILLKDMYSHILILIPVMHSYVQVDEVGSLKQKIRISLFC